MLDISVTMTGDKVVIERLGDMEQQNPRAIDRALNRAAKGIHREAFAYLSGKGGASKKKRKDYTGFIKKSGEAVGFRAYLGAGNWPVPVRTGNLRRLLDYVKPGETKSGPAGTFSAGKHEVIVYDSAEYAGAIHEGLGSSRKFGRRPFLVGGFKKFNQGERLKTILMEEITKGKRQ